MESTLRRCKTCGEEKPLQRAFFQWVGGDGYFRNTCKSCDNARQRAWCKSHPDRVKASAAKYYQGNVVRLREVAKANKSKRRVEANAYSRVWRAALKVEMFAAYGNECACCGEREVRFLTLEHSRRDGGSHRRRLGGQTQVYCELKRLGWPKDGFELLCWNCQMATRFGQQCPHQMRKESAA